MILDFFTNFIQFLIEFYFNFLPKFLDFKFLSFNISLILVENFGNLAFDLDLFGLDWPVIYLPEVTINDLRYFEDAFSMEHMIWVFATFFAEQS